MLTHKKYKQIALLILDGFGVASKSRGNAVTLAGTPVLDNLISRFPHATLQASGPLVGLPFGEPGNSEVGHLSIGAGRIIGQDLPRITKSIEDGSFFNNPAFLAASEHVKKHNSKLHLVGLVSDGGVHSFNEHLYALLGFADKEGIEKTYVHFFSDGRDAPRDAAVSEVAKLELKFQEIGVGKIATIMGRFYAMDRGGHWQQTLDALNTMTKALAPSSPSAIQTLEASYQNAIYDELVKPVVLTDPTSGKPIALIEENDAVIFFNFRQDRMVQLSTAFLSPQKTPIAEKIELPSNLLVVTMTEYVPGQAKYVAFPGIKVNNHLSEVLSKNGLSQAHMSESEKYAHVTMFFNCGQRDALQGETREVIESPKDNSSSYANVPEMSADLLTKKIIEVIKEGKTNFIVANFANADMVGHTGNLNASIKAVKKLDECIGKIAEACLETDTCLIITADHGNIEQMLDLRSGNPDTDHTSNPVPLLLIAKEWEKSDTSTAGYQSLAAMVPIGMIADVAPTILELFDIPVPSEMRSVNLLPEFKANI